MYLTAQIGPVTVIGNISLERITSGSQFRSGGTFTNNTFIHDPYGHNIGQPYAGVQTLVNNNVHIEQMDNTVNGGSVVSVDTINTFSSYDGQAFNLGTATFSGNIIVHNGTPNTNGGGINIDSGQVGSVVENNIACNWKQNSAAPSGVLIWSQSSTRTLTGNYQDVADCDHNNYPSPDLTVGTYDTSLGTGSCGGNTVGTTANFICKARGQSVANWSNALMAAAFNAYIGAGFGITSSSSSSSTSSSSTASTTPPSVPSGLAGTVASATQINLSWQASTDSAGVVGGYNVFRNGNQVGTSTNTSYQDTGLSAGTTYTYAVSAYNTAGNTSAQSSSISISTPAATPTPPTVADQLRPQTAPCLGAIRISTLLPLQAIAAALSRRSRSQPVAKPLRHAPTRPLALLRCRAGIFHEERWSSRPPRAIRRDKIRALQLRSYRSGDNKHGPTGPFLGMVPCLLGTIGALTCTAISLILICISQQRYRTDPDANI